MNERIKKLAEQAGFETGLVYGNPEGLQKFAELMVRECCDIVRQCRFAPDEDAIVNEIVNHFGVE
jgi:hypothetical protein